VESNLPRYHLRENVSRADDDFVERIAEVRATFLAHVRDALAERHQ